MQARRLAEGGHCSQIHERGYRGAPLGAEQRARNQAKSPLGRPGASADQKLGPGKRS